MEEIYVVIDPSEVVEAIEYLDVCDPPLELELIAARPYKAFRSWSDAKSSAELDGGAIIRCELCDM